MKITNLISIGEAKFIKNPLNTQLNKIKNESHVEKNKQKMYNLQ